MLNVPSSVKTLYQTDGVRKNFRVHFPNGEYADITNDNVVQESVKFTESLSSQSTFKFGLAEASVLEFETVGVGNMFGMTIEASMEIDGSSLSAADKAAIAAGTWDGTWDSVNEVFGIPLGTFRVNSCPRDHQSMAHRQVTAYSLMGGVNLTSPFETAKLRCGAPLNSVYTPNVHRLVYASLGWENPDVLSGFTKSAYGTWTSFPTGTGSPTRMIGADSSYRYQMTLNITERQLQFGSVIDADKLYSLEVEKTLYDSVRNTIKNYCEETLGISSTGALLLIDEFLNISANSSAFGGGGYQTRGIIPVFYPEYAGDYYIHVPESVNIQIARIPISSGPTVVVLNANFNNLVVNPVLYQYTDGFANLSISLEPTGTTSTGLYATFINSYNLEELLPSYLEVIAEFGKSSRLNGTDMIRLDNTSPESVLPNNYAECWWDEYDVDPIGTVTIVYKDSDSAEQTTDISIGDGLSRYDMTNNELLKNLASASLSDVTSIITTDFAPYTDEVAFTPVELTMQGWPWLEAGDALEITAEDGTIVETYALRVEMSGIQHLQSVITAEGGEIIEEVS